MALRPSRSVSGTASEVVWDESPDCFVLSRLRLVVASEAKAL